MKVDYQNKVVTLQSTYCQNRVFPKFSSERQVEVSLYNNKGVSVPFCGITKGADFVEENCIRMIRKVRENRCRKFDESDIKDMIISLRKEKNADNKEGLLKEVFCLESCDDCKLPNKSIIKNVLNVIAGRPQDERFAVLEFSQYEINNATKPMEAFCSLPKAKQDKLIGILKNIESLNTTPVLGEKSGMLDSNVSDALYDSFRVLVYAEDDLSKLKPEQINDYKVKTFHLLKSDCEYFENLTYPDKKSKLNVKNIVEGINKYFIENIL